jgi:hypothetical protein
MKFYLLPLLISLLVLPSRADPADHSFDTGNVDGRVVAIYKEGLLVDGTVQNSDPDQRIPAKKNKRVPSTFLLIGYPGDIDLGYSIHAKAYQDKMIYLVTAPHTTLRIHITAQTYIFVAKRRPAAAP